MKITIYLAASVNGMISNSRNVPDWLSPEYVDGFMEISQRTRAVIMGKTTYNILAPDNLPLKDDGMLVVMTHDTQAKPPQNNILFTDIKPAEIVQLLESKGYSEAVIIGGAAAVSEFVKAGYANELILVVEPRLFANGLPLLKDVEDDIKLELAEVKQLGADTVKLHYKIKTA
jgi:dihydrofolate reductase